MSGVLRGVLMTTLPSRVICRVIGFALAGDLKGHGLFSALAPDYLVSLNISCHYNSYSSPFEGTRVLNPSFSCTIFSNARETLSSPWTMNTSGLF